MVRHVRDEPDYQRASRLLGRTGAPEAGTVLAVTGVWLVLAPSVLEYPNGVAVVNDGVIGTVVAVVAITGVAARRAAPWSCGVTAVLGAWEAASPFVLGHAAVSVAVINEAAVGVVLVVVSLAGVASVIERECVQSSGPSTPPRWRRAGGAGHEERR